MQPSSRRNLPITTIGMATAINFVSYLDRVCMSVAGPLITKEFGFTPTQLGWVFGIFSLSYALLQVPWGMVADKFGGRKIVAQAMCGWSLLTAMTATAYNLPSLLAIRFAFGALAGGGCHHPSDRTRGRTLHRIWIVLRRGKAWRRICPRSHGCSRSPLGLESALRDFCWCWPARGGFMAASRPTDQSLRTKQPVDFLESICHSASRRTPNDILWVHVHVAVLRHMVSDIPNGPLRLLVVRDGSLCEPAFPVRNHRQLGRGIFN